MTLSFDPVAHEYRAGDKRVPSVTEVLGATGMLPDYSHLEPFYAQRGTAVHACIKLHFSGRKIDWSFEGAEEVQPRFERFLQFAGTASLEPLLTEERLLSRDFNYAGTVDYVGSLGRQGLVIVDWKGESAHPLYALQIAGYRGLLMENARDLKIDLGGIATCPAYLIPLGGSGDLPSPLPIPYDPNDVNVFRGLAAAYNWRLARAPRRANGEH